MRTRSSAADDNCSLPSYCFCSLDVCQLIIIFCLSFSLRVYPLVVGLSAIHSLAAKIGVFFADKDMASSGLIIDFYRDYFKIGEKSRSRPLVLLPLAVVLPPPTSLLSFISFIYLDVD
jgi:hypothetical protein